MTTATAATAASPIATATSGGSVQVVRVTAFMLPKPEPATPKK